MVLPDTAHVVIGWQSNGRQQVFGAVVLERGQMPRMVAIVDDRDMSLAHCFAANYRQPLFEPESKERAVPS